MTKKTAKELLRRCRPGSFLLRDSDNPQYLFSLSQNLHFVGPIATRIFFQDGLFWFDDGRTRISKGSRGSGSTSSHSSHISNVSSQNLPYPTKNTEQSGHSGNSWNNEEHMSPANSGNNPITPERGESFIGQTEQDPVAAVGLRCVVSLIEHWAKHYQSKNIMAIRYPLNESNSPDNDGLAMPHKCSVTVYDDAHKRPPQEFNIPKHIPNTIPFGHQLANVSVNARSRDNKNQKLNMPTHLFIPEPQGQIERTDTSEEMPTGFSHNRNTSVEAQQNSSGANGFLALTDLKKYLERSNDGETTTTKTESLKDDTEEDTSAHSIERQRRHSMFSKVGHHQMIPSHDLPDPGNAKTMCPNCGFSFIPNHLIVPFWKTSNIPVKAGLQGFTDQPASNRFNPFQGFQSHVSNHSSTMAQSSNKIVTDCSTSQSSFLTDSTTNVIIKGFENIGSSPKHEILGDTTNSLETILNKYNALDQENKKPLIKRLSKVIEEPLQSESSKSSTSANLQRNCSETSVKTKISIDKTAIDYTNTSLEAHPRSEKNSDNECDIESASSISSD